CRPRLSCRNGTSTLPPPACNAPERLFAPIASVWIQQLCDSRAAAHAPSTAGYLSSICHDTVIKPIDDVRTLRLLCFARENSHGRQNALGRTDRRSIRETA